MDIRYEKETKKSFHEAIESIAKELKERNFGVLWQLNFKDKLKEHDIDFPNNFQVLEVCNPQQANEVLTKHIDVGFFLPCKVAVYEVDGMVKIGTIKPTFFMNMMEYDDLADVGKEVEDIIIESINAAV